MLESVENGASLEKALQEALKGVARTQPLLPFSSVPVGHEVNCSAPPCVPITDVLLLSPDNSTAEEGLDSVKPRP